MVNLSIRKKSKRKYTLVAKNRNKKRKKKDSVNKEIKDKKSIRSRSKKLYLKELGKNYSNYLPKI